MPIGGRLCATNICLATSVAGVAKSEIGQNKSSWCCALSCDLLSGCEKSKDTFQPRTNVISELMILEFPL